MSAQHTPGPWKLYFWSENVGVGTDRPKPRDCESIAVVPRGPETGDVADRAKADANARLIAAAPDLLAALTELLHKVDLPQQAMGLAADIHRARAAIAKAEGK